MLLNNAVIFCKVVLLFYERAYSPTENSRPSDESNPNPNPNLTLNPNPNLT